MKKLGDYDGVDMGTVDFVAFNMDQQIAIDAAGNTWKVTGWYDLDGDEITDRWENPDQLARDTTPNVNCVNWEYVDFVTVQFGEQHSHLRPDDFNEGLNG